MKKLMLLMIMVVGLVSPIVSQASTVQETNANVQVTQNSGIQPRGVYTYIFPSVPPKKFNGMTRFYYEYKSKEKYYIGYYQ